VNSGPGHHALAILNATPDSFSDGGEVFDAERFKTKIEHLRQGGICHFDIGAQSTAPTAQTGLSQKQEMERYQRYVFPALNLLCATGEQDLSLSFDTFRPQVFQHIFDFLSARGFKGEIWWNDVSGLYRQDVAAILCQAKNIRYVLCHNLVGEREKTPDHYQKSLPATDAGFLAHMQDFFTQARHFFQAQDLSAQIIFDPCFGFAKSREQNLWLLAHLPQLILQFSNETPWLLGISRKSFLRYLVQSGLPNSQEFSIQEIFAMTEWHHAACIALWRSKLKDYSVYYRVHQALAVQSLLLSFPF